jgi:DNA-binding protein HU-beta
VPGGAYTIREYLMTKQELAQKVAADAHIAGAQAKSAVDAAFAAIASELAAGGDVAIAGFGKFSVSERAARDGRNPFSGETIQMPPVPSRSSQLPPR